MASVAPPSGIKEQASDLEGEKTKKESDVSSSQSKDLSPESNQAAAANEEDQWVTGIKLFNISAALTLVCFLMLLDIAIVSTAIPRITSDFHSLSDIGWYGGAYSLATAAFQMLTGKLFMNFSSKWTFLSFFAIFELGSLICGVATSSKMLIVGRAIAGIGGSGLVNGTLTIVASCVPMAKRPSLVGFIMGTANLGLAMGPLIGGVFTQFVTWRWCFYINLPVGGLAAAMILFNRIPDQIPKAKPMSVVRTIHSKLDLIGFALFAPAAVQFLLALQYGGNQFAWNSSQVIGLFCGAGGTFIVFLAWEYHKSDAAMMPFSMIRQPIVWASSVAYGLMMAQLFCSSYYLPVYFQAVKGVSPVLSGVYILPSVLSQLFSVVASGALVGRLGYYLPFIVIGAAMVAVANGLLSTLSPGTSTGRWIGYQILLGTGRGISLQMPIIAVQNTLPPAQIALAMAFLMFSQSFAGALFLSFSDTILTNSLKTLISKYAPSINPQTVINDGATRFRMDVPGAALANVLVAYAKSIDRIFYMSAGMGVGCFIFAWGMGWKDIRKKSEVSKA